FLADDGVVSKAIVVANQLDQVARLQRSVLALLHETFGDKLAATIERDPIVDEALASRRMENSTERRCRTPNPDPRDPRAASGRRALADRPGIHHRHRLGAGHAGA